jgi:hypothetical protein
MCSSRIFEEASDNLAKEGFILCFAAIWIIFFRTAIPSDGCEKAIVTKQVPPIKISMIQYMGPGHKK